MINFSEDVHLFNCQTMGFTCNLT